MANSVYPDQMPCSVASDLGLHCLLRLSVPMLSVITVVYLTICTKKFSKSVPMTSRSLRGLRAMKDKNQNHHSSHKLNTSKNSADM